MDEVAGAVGGRTEDGAPIVVGITAVVWASAEGGVGIEGGAHITDGGRHKGRVVRVAGLKIAGESKFVDVGRGVCGDQTRHS